MGYATIGILIGLAAVILCVVSVWRIFTKAGRPGWAAIVPIYNLYVWIKTADQPWWLLLFYVVPLFGYIVSLGLCVLVAKKFRQDWPFGIGMFLVPFVFLPILAFGRSEYVAGDPFLVGPAGQPPNRPSNRRFKASANNDAAVARRARQQMKDAGLQ